MVSSKADGGVVRSLEDKTSKFVSNRMHSFSHLESIEIYTTGENVNLVDIFNAMKDSGEAMPDAGDAKAVKSYFEKVYPDMDFDRVYSSDMKKIVKWFGILNNAGVDIKLSGAPAPEADENDTTTETAESESKETPKAKEKKTTAEKTEKKTNKTASSAKTAAPKSAPAKKINSPRKMA